MPSDLAANMARVLPLRNSLFAQLNAVVRT